MKILKYTNRLLLLFMILPFSIYYFFPQKPLPKGAENSFQAIATTIENTDKSIVSIFFIAWAWWAICFFWLYNKLVLTQAPETMALTHFVAVSSIILSMIWMTIWVGSAVSIYLMDIPLYENKILYKAFSYIIPTCWTASCVTYIAFFGFASKKLYSSYLLAPLIWLFLPLIALYEEYFRPVQKPDQ